MKFNPEFVPLILNGTKTQTRRLGKKRWRENTIQKCQAGESAFAKVRILSVNRESLGQISDEDVRNEGFGTKKAFQEAWTAIYGSWEDEKEVWVIKFRLVGSIDS